MPGLHKHECPYCKRKDTHGHRKDGSVIEIKGDICGQEFDCIFVDEIIVGGAGYASLHL